MSATTTDAAEPRDARRDGFALVAAMAGLMWAVEVLDRITGGDLEALGIEPHRADGLIGVVAAPFLHADFAHLMSNTVPFLVLGFAIALSGVLRVVAVTAIVMLVGGMGVWLFAAEGSLHIGASGVVFGYAGYVISRGVFNRSVLELVMGAVVAGVWGSALLGGLLPQDGISWQGHFFGAVGGVVAAYVLRRERAGAPA